MRKLLFACSLFVASIASLQAQVFADKVLDAGPCDPIVPIFCPGGVQNADHAVDTDPTSFALLRTDVGIISNAFIELAFPGTPTIGSFIGFQVEENNTILNVDLLETLIIEVLDTAGVVIASRDDFNLTDLNLLLDGSEGRLIGVQTPDTGDYQIRSVRLSLTGLVSLINDLKVFSGICIESNPTCYFENQTNIINSVNVQDVENLQDANDSNFALMSIPLSVLQSAELEVELDAVASTGDFVGCVVEPNNTFLELGVLQNITIEAFDTAGVLVASKSDFSIADLSLIANDPGRSIVGIDIPAGPDSLGGILNVSRVKFTLNPNVGLLTELRVYNLFIARNLVSGMTITKSSDKLCGGGSMTLTAEGGYDSYLWNTGETTQSITITTGGTYSVVGTSAFDCAGTGGKVSKSFTKKIPAERATSGSILIETEEYTTTFETTSADCNTANGGTTIFVTGGSGSYTYVWSTGDTTATISGHQAGTYSCTITDLVTGCSFVRTVDINSTEGVFFTGFVVHATEGQDNGEIYLSIDERDSVTVTWNDGSTSYVRQGLAPGEYTCTARTADNCVTIKRFIIVRDCGCKGGGGGNGGFDFSITIVKTEPSCGGNDGAIDVTVSEPTRVYTYNWSNGSTSQDISNLNGGIYRLIVTDVASGLQLDTTLSLDETNSPAISLAASNEEVCSGDRNASLTVNPGLPINQIEWNNGVTTATNSNLAPGTYSVIVTSPITNCSAFAEYEIVRRDPVQLFIGSTDVTCDPDSADGTAFVSTLGGRNPFSFDWSNGASTDTISNLEAGLYSVLVTDANGCAMQDSVFVLKGSKCEDGDGPGGSECDPNDKPEIVTQADILNVFTPNNDGINDTWKIVGDADCYATLEVKVYNRYGDEVFTTKRYSSNWGGTYMDTNESLPEGTYFYVIEAKRGGVTRNIKGFVAIKR